MTLCVEYRQVKGKTEEDLHKQMRAVGTSSADIHTEWDLTNLKWLALGEGKLFHW
jgi:hypothetical protein